MFLLGHGQLKNGVFKPRGCDPNGAQRCYKPNGGNKS